MYIQSPQENSLQLPRDYSGSAFPPPEAEQSEQAPPEVERAVPDPGEPSRGSEEPPDEQEQEAIPAGAMPRKGERREYAKERGGLFSGLSPLFSSLLPPARGGHAEKSTWRDLIVVGIALLLFLGEERDDLLPLLLLLLLWD